MANSQKSSALHYRIIGEGHPLIILHALGTDHRSMQAWLEPIFDQHKAWKRIYIDIPAHGKSTIEPWMKTSEDLLDVLLDFIDTILPNERFSLIGSSFGGYLAQGIFHRKYEWVDGLCLLVPAIHAKERNLPPKIVVERDENVISNLEKDVADAVQTLLVYQNETNINSFLHEVQPGRLLADREFLTSSWRTKGYYFSFEPFYGLGPFDQPSLILLGRQDSICGYEDHLHVFLKKFHHATISILDRTGHLIQIEQRALVQSLCNEWLMRVRERIEQNQKGVL